MKRFIFVGIPCIMSMSLLLVCNAIFSADSLENKLDRYIQTYYSPSTFSGSALIAKDDTILLKKSYGMADYEKSIPNTPDTIFRIGSITKQFTAMAILILEERGLLRVTDTISTYIPDYRYGKEITIHQLLTNSSGIPTYTDSPDYAKEKGLSYTLNQVIEKFKNKPLNFKPGEKYEYSNSGYALLAYIIEKVSGKTYEDFLAEHIFKPLHMDHSGYYSRNLTIKNQATGYKFYGRGVRIKADYVDASFLTGGGALYSTVGDLYLWDQALYGGKLVSKKTIAKMFIPYVSTHSNALDSSHYGYGWGIGKLYGRNIVRHGGLFDGFAANLCRYLDDKVCIILLGNIDNFPVGPLAQDLAAILFNTTSVNPSKESSQFVLPANLYKQYVGIYQLEGEAFNIVQEKEQLRIVIPGEKVFEIYPQSEIEFNNEFIGIKLVFEKDPKGKIVGCTLYQDNVPYKLQKIA